MGQIKWYECNIPDEEIVGKTLFKFQEKMRQALLTARWPKEAAVFGEAGVGAEGVKLWITSSAAQAAVENGFQWRRYYVKELTNPPFKKEAILLLGHQSAWDLLKEGGKDPFRA